VSSLQLQELQERPLSRGPGTSSDKFVLCQGIVSLKLQN
jgi:hypothetical protein